MHRRFFLGRLLVRQFARLGVLFLRPPPRCSASRRSRRDRSASISPSLKTLSASAISPTSSRRPTPAMAMSRPPQRNAAAPAALSRRSRDSFSVAFGVGWMPRANWKGYLRLSLVSCPIALFPATAESARIRFHNLNKATGNRIRMQRIDAATGDEVAYDDLVKGYEVAKNEYIVVEPDELDAIAIDSTRMIDIERFVPRGEIDSLHADRPYYIVPDGEVGQQAFAVIREAIKRTDMVALGRVVLSSREHVMAIEPRRKGLIGLLLRYTYEVRGEDEYFADIPDVDTPKDMVDIAAHIVQSKAGHFAPDDFEDRYETALAALIDKKRKGEKVTPAKPQRLAPVHDLMAALRASVAKVRPGERAPARRAASARHPAKKKSRTAARRRA
jgi:DNA end-binding protein Ku